MGGGENYVTKYNIYYFPEKVRVELTVLYNWLNGQYGLIGPQGGYRTRQVTLTCVALPGGPAVHDLLKELY